MKTNQKGFSVVEIVIVIVIVGLIGSAGWYVWQSKQKDSKVQKSPSTVQVKQQETPKEEPKKAVTDTKSGSRLYDDSNLSLQFPEAWKISTDNERSEWVFFESPDYIPATELGPSVIAGQYLEVRVSKSESWESYDYDLKAAPTAQENHGGTYEKIKIDGNNAILSDTKTHGTYWHATTYANGKTYFFRFNALDEDKPEVKELFKSILATVDIK